MDNKNKKNAITTKKTISTTKVTVLDKDISGA